MDTHAAHAETLQFVTFKLGSQRYAMDILKVQEINNMKDITPIPNAPDYVEGAINLRGKVIPVLNLRKKFHMEEHPLNSLSKIIIMDMLGIVMGVIVDSVSDVLRISADILEPSPPIAATGLRSEFVRGIAKLQDGLVIVLDMDKLFNAVELNSVFGKS